ncbi:unnamed protein product [Coregonus sp. 'balchen']|nr:unnamed protein product [Coregonus sp. 'balchen']
MIDLEGDAQSSNETSAQHDQDIYFPNNETQSTGYFLLVVLLCFSTRLYKIITSLTCELALPRCSSGLLSAPLCLPHNTGCITISQYILLDPILMFFIMGALLSMWFWLVLTGVNLSGALGVKFVGLFYILLTWHMATITVKNLRIAGGYPNSHWHLYPEGVGAKQQQVSAYLHKDYNNLWLVQRPDDSDGERTAFLCSQNTHNQENLTLFVMVTLFDRSTKSDPNDLWQVEACGGRKGDLVKVLRSKVRYLHHATGCVLYSSGKTLPKWGWEQVEVTCSPYLKETPNSQWNIEDPINSKCSLHSIPFISGLRFSGVNETEYHVYLLGNPVIWWLNLVSPGLYVVMVAAASLALRRGVQLDKRRTEHCCMLMEGGGLLHYVPFYTMGHILYYYHYFPAMLFSSMLTGITLDTLLQSADLWLRPHYSHWLLRGGQAMLFLTILYSFYLFKPHVMREPLTHDPGSTMGGSWEF